MYLLHPDPTLNALFAAKPYQGADPRSANFLFIGLDANFDLEIAKSPIYPKILEYLSDGVAFWQKHGVHHPFLLPNYTGDGRRYHRTFAQIGFTPAMASQVSFVELVHKPTYGQSKLDKQDLDAAHMRWLSELMLEGKARHVFISDKVARMMRASNSFPWLPKEPSANASGLSIWSRNDKRSVYKHLHFSNYGKFQAQLTQELNAIRALVS